MFVVLPTWSPPEKLPLKTSYIKIPRPYASTAVRGLRLIISQPPLLISGGLYRAESGMRLPYVYIPLSASVAPHHARKKKKMRLTNIMASSSFMELKTSNPPSFHSPLSLVNTDETRTAPWTDEASSLMNFSVDYSHPISTKQAGWCDYYLPTATVYSPHFAVSSVTLLRFTDQDSGTTLSVTM